MEASRTFTARAGDLAAYSPRATRATETLWGLSATALANAGADGIRRQVAGPVISLRALRLLPP
jgi:cytochrome c-type biogenesis protein CcmH/NrfF